MNLVKLGEVYVNPDNVTTVKYDGHKRVVVSFLEGGTSNFIEVPNMSLEEAVERLTTPVNHTEKWTTRGGAHSSV
jgi:hypothetical protein